MRNLKKLFFCVLLLGSFFLAGADPLFISPKMVSNMKYGKTHEDIKFLQKTLNTFGYFATEDVNPIFDGKFDSVLKDSLIDFQKTNDLKPSGQVDQETLKVLNDFLNYKLEAMAKEENPNNFLDTESVDKYSGDFSYTSSNIFDFYKNIPLLGSALNILAPKKSTVTTKTDIRQKVNFTVFDCLRNEQCEYNSYE